MSFSVNGDTDLQIMVNGKELPSTTGIILQSLVVKETTTTLPTMDLILDTHTELVDENPIADNSPIDIVLTTTNSQGSFTESWSFSVMNHASQPHQSGWRVSCYCILNVPYLLQAAIQSYEGPAYRLMEYVAAQSGLTANVDRSLDSQVWLCPGIRRHVWLKDVTRHSWGSASSAYVSAITRGGELRFFDLSLQSRKAAQLSFVPETSEEDDQVAFIKPVFRSQSGLLNRTYGYGRRSSYFDIFEGRTHQIENLNFRKHTTSVQVSKSAQRPQRYDNLGYDVGNTHDKYLDAQVQNLRLRALYSTLVDIGTEEFRNIQLLDRVALQLYDYENDEMRSKYAGAYYVSSVVTTLTQSSNVRDLTLVREGTNDQVEDLL